MPSGFQIFLSPRAQFIPISSLTDPFYFRRYINDDDSLDFSSHDDYISHILESHLSHRTFTSQLQFSWSHFRCHLISTFSFLRSQFYSDFISHGPIQAYMSLLTFTDILLWLQQHAASADSLRALPCSLWTKLWLLYNIPSQFHPSANDDIRLVEWAQCNPFSSTAAGGAHSVQVAASAGPAHGTHSVAAVAGPAQGIHSVHASHAVVSAEAFHSAIPFILDTWRPFNPLTDATIEIDADPSEAPCSHRSHHDPSHHHGHSINWHSLTTNIRRASILPWYLSSYWHDPFPTTKQPYPWQIALSFLRFVNIFLTDTQLAWRPHTEITRCILFSFHITDNSFKPLRRLAPLRVNLLNLTFR